MKKIAWVTTARSEYNASRWVINAIDEDPEFDFYLIADETDGFSSYPIGSYNATSTKDACFSLSDILRETSEMLMDIKPDLIIINGDRIELMSIVLAATIHGIPICHIGGGDITDGSTDNLTRYAISRYAHLHLVSDEQAAQNLIQSGEEPWRVHTVGQCGLENIARTEKLSLEDTSNRIGLDLSIPTALCIYYPSLEPGIETGGQIIQLLRALHETNTQTIFIYPCEELGSDYIRDKIKVYCGEHLNCKAFANLDNQLFQSVLWHSAFMIGNSSAGVIEAPFINKWSINVGNRQSGRKKPESVLDVGYHTGKISHYIEWVCKNMKAPVVKQVDLPSQKIVQVIKDNIDKPELLYKKIILGGQK